MTRKGGSGRSVGLVIAAVLLSITSSLPVAGSATPIAMGGVSGGDVPVPASQSLLGHILAQPWTARAGYEPQLFSSVEAVTPLGGETVDVVLTLQPSNPAFLGTASGPSLNQTEIGAEFGASPASYDGLIQYFTSHGLTVTHTWPNRLFLSLSGPARAVGSAFGTTLASGTYGGRSVRFPLTAPSVPPALESEISAVSGLSEGFTTFSAPVLPAETPTPFQGRTTTTVTPSAAHLLYGLDGLYNYSGGTHWATGIGIATILWGEGYDPADLKGFFASYYPGGFPSLTIQAYPVDGAPAPSANALNDPSNVTSEMTLDIEWAGSAAPGATIDAVYAPDGPASDGYSPTDASLEDALNTASQQVAGVEVISMSFGSPDGQDLSFQAAYETALKAAAMAGETVLAASGDNGGVTSAGCHGALAPEYPAASQWVVAVGGTAPVVSLNALGTVTGLDSEPAWNRSGGGYSVTYPNPSWQVTGSGPGPAQTLHRGIPDVAGPAQDNIFYYNGAEAAGAGTSFAAPFWAGIVAEMDGIRGAPLGWITPRLYSVGIDEQKGTAAAGLADITSGSNCVASASAGWDPVTGWGTPRAAFLYPDLVQTFVNVSLVTSASSIAPGGSFVTTATITNATDHAPLEGLNVTITVDSPGYVGPCGGPFSDTALTTDSNGTVTVSTSIPSCYLGSSAVVTATVSGKYYGASSVTVHVNLVGLSKLLAIVQVFPYNVLTFVVLVVVTAFLGWRIGEWNHRRRMRIALQNRPRPPLARPAAPAVAAAPATAPPSPAPAAPAPVPAAPPSPPTVTPDTSSVAGPSGPLTEPEASEATFAPEPEGPAADVTVPDHVAAHSDWVTPAPLDAGAVSASEVPDHVAGPPGPSPPALCPSCGAVLPGDTATCPSCGAAVGGR